MDAFDGSPLVSPTKARQAAIQAKDWAYVNSWLGRQYAPKPVPQFERNQDTLRVLLTMAAANEAADEEASLQHRAREEAVRAFKTREETERNNPHERQKNEILDEVEICLDDRGKRDLDDLADSAVVLGNTLNPEPEDLSLSIVELTAEVFDTQDQLDKVETLHLYLQKELSRLQADLEELKTNKAYETPADTQSLTAEWTRGTKTLTTKVGEYQDRIASLERNQPRGPTIQELMTEEENVVQLRETVKALEGRVKAFHDLPRDVPRARARYKELERELDQLTRQRENMFGSLVDRR
jgi:HAUS augmin-like complex subunit 1